MNQTRVRVVGTRYPPHVRHRAKELLAQGMSLHAVSRETGVGVGVLSKVRRGQIWKNDDYGVVEVLSRGSKPTRCKCGALVYPPCLACAIRDKKEGKAR